MNRWVCPSMQTVLAEGWHPYEIPSFAGNSPSPFLGSGTTLAAAEATQRVWLRNRRYARVRALSKLPCARATTVLGLEHFRATADGGVLALSFVTALLARPWKVGVPCQDHLRECSRRAAGLGTSWIVGSPGATKEQTLGV